MPALDLFFVQQPGIHLVQLDEIQQILDQRIAIPVAGFQSRTKVARAQDGAQHRNPRFPPARGLLALEKRTGKNQGLGGLGRISDIQRSAESLAQKPGLHHQIAPSDLIQPVPVDLPLDPIHDTARQTVGLPAHALARRVGHDPVRDQFFVPLEPGFGAVCNQVIEGMQIPQPILPPGAPMPSAIVGEHALDPEKIKCLRAHHRRGTPAKTPLPRRVTQYW